MFTSRWRSLARPVARISSRLSMQWFKNRIDAKVLIEELRRQFNEVQPHDIAPKSWTYTKKHFQDADN
jgi:hypothetical protein